MAPIMQISIGVSLMGRRAALSRSIPQSALFPRIRCFGPTMLNASGGLLLNLTPKVGLNQRLEE